MQVCFPLNGVDDRPKLFSIDQQENGIMATIPCTANVSWLVRFWRWPRVPMLNAWRCAFWFRVPMSRYPVRHSLSRLQRLWRPVLVDRVKTSHNLSARLAAAEHQVTELTRQLEAARARAAAQKRTSRCWQQRAQQLSRDLIGSLECPICLEALRDTQTVALVPCGHVLCARCAQVTAQRSQCLVCSARLQALPVCLRGLAPLFACVHAS